LTGTSAPLAVVTRPRADSQALAQRLAARGYRVLIEPMLTIAPTETELPPLAPYDALVFTSAQAVAEFSRRTSERDRPAFAVGAATARALTEAGFRDLRVGDRGAAELALWIARDLGPGRRLLHVAGRDVAADFVPLLQPDGIVVDRVAVYRAEAATGFSVGLAAALYARTVSVVLFFSARTARTFGCLVMKHGVEKGCQDARALCFSDQVAAAAISVPWREVRVAARPSVDALLDLLPIPDRDSLDIIWPDDN
jgi:uroporphyrinogen-III synthase